MAQAGIEPATFRFVAQHLNHCATADNILNKYNLFTDMLPQHLVGKNELNCEYCNITLARNNKAP